jgi:hypothetical protein
VFSAEIPESIDLDEHPETIAQIMDGSFLALACPSCDSTLKPEFPISVRWASHAALLRVFPEFDRGYLYRHGFPKDSGDILIGYPELADRIAVLRDGLDPMAVETLKYYLLLKAEEADPDAEVNAWFQGKAGTDLEFHIHGLRPEEVAVSRIPIKMYEKTAEEYRVHPLSEPFQTLKRGSYLSIQNVFRSEENT